MIDGECQLKLVDLGYAQQYNKGDKNCKIVGTDTYMAPEMFRIG